MIKKKREIISYREIGDEINPLNMTHKEFINYLCHQFGFRIADGWDGVERRHYRPNFTEEKSHNIKDRDEALIFLGISKSKNSPDGLEKRAKVERRQRSLDIRKNKLDRREKRLRRIEERNDSITFYLASFSAFAIILAWFLIIIYFNYIKG